MSRVPPFSALDFHSIVFSPLYKSPIEWDPKKRRIAFTPSLRATLIWTIITLGFEIFLAQVSTSYLLISQFWWPQSSKMSTFQILDHGIILFIATAQGVVMSIFWIYWDDWKFGWGQQIWLLERIEESKRGGSISALFMEN
ncbi:hypothetical protein Fcan01_16944 [Folsomia candida]|uniref:Uncharacterized protein n=1 Tax=Folsomia candida TaxID=158441 RepID=A0A226DUR9_FOLCA|nr:hypothetical protein Fcan01_16944 [Folsomia candida]